MTISAQDFTLFHLFDYFFDAITIANKEARETFYWLNLLKDTGFLKIDQFEDLQNRCLELRRLISSIIISTKRNTKTL